MIWDFMKYENNTALDEGERTYTYAELHAAGETITDGMKAHSLVFQLTRNTAGSVAGYTAFLNHGIVPLMYPVSSDPREQNYFQVLSLEEKHKVLRGLLTGAMAHGCESAFIYCNSLSGSVYFPALAEELGLKIVTPMDVYGALAVRYSKLAIIAYNAQAMMGQDIAMMRANPDIIMLHASVAQVAIDIERGYAPEEIIRRNHLDMLTQYFEACGCEALVLGCTHFPYVSEALSRCTRLPLLDPAEDMVRILLEK